MNREKLKLYLDIARYNRPDDFIDIVQKHKAFLYGVDLSFADLSGADLRNADLSNADLRNANMSNADLRGAKMSGADLRGANMSNAKMSCADMSNADLSGADLSGANMSNADLSGADLSNAKMSCADLSGSQGILDPVQWLKENFSVTEKGILVYKSFGKHYQPRDEWVIAEGSTITETGNPNRADECGCGINFAARTWEGFNEGDEIWECLIEWWDLAGVVVPFNTDGKARCGRLTLICKVQGE